MFTIETALAVLIYVVIAVVFGRYIVGAILLSIAFFLELILVIAGKKNPK